MVRKGLDVQCYKSVRVQTFINKTRKRNKRNISIKHDNNNKNNVRACNKIHQGVKIADSSMEISSLVKSRAHSGQRSHRQAARDAKDEHADRGRFGTPIEGAVGHPEGGAVGSPIEGAVGHPIEGVLGSPVGGAV